MRELTIHDLDAQLAESLPDRDLMAILYSFNNLAAAAANSGFNHTVQVGGLNVADTGNTNIAAAAAFNLIY